MSEGSLSSSLIKYLLAVHSLAIIGLQFALLVESTVAWLQPHCLCVMSCFGSSLDYMWAGAPCGISTNH